MLKCLDERPFILRSLVMRAMLHYQHVETLGTGSVLQELLVVSSCLGRLQKLILTSALNWMFVARSA